MDHLLGALAQLTQFGRPAPETVKLGCKRHTFGHFGGDPRAARPQAAVQRLEPRPGDGQSDEHDRE